MGIKFNDKDRAVLTHFKPNKIYSWKELTRIKVNQKPIHHEQLRRSIDKLSQCKLIKKLDKSKYTLLDNKKFDVIFPKQQDLHYLEEKVPHKVSASEGNINVYGAIKLVKNHQNYLKRIQKIIEELDNNIRNGRLEVIKKLYTQQLSKISDKKLKQILKIKKYKDFFCDQINNSSLWDPEELRDYLKIIRGLYRLDGLPTEQRQNIPKNTRLFHEIAEIIDGDIFVFLVKIIEDMQKNHPDTSPDIMLTYKSPGLINFR